MSVNKWAVLAVVLVGVFMAMIDSSIVNVALPVLVNSLHTDFSTIQWVPLAYMIAVTCSMMLVGRLADTWGKRGLYTLGFIVFTAASVACGRAGGVQALLAARVVQGLGAAIIMALGPAILVETFPPQERGRALGITGSVVSLGIILGPTTGGLILSSVGWSWIFYVNVPFGVVGALMALRLISTKKPATAPRFDLIGASALTAGLFCVLLGLTVGQRPGTDSLTTWALVGGGSLSLVAFVFIELRRPDPLVDLRLFNSVIFSNNLAASFLNFIALAGMVVLMPFYLQVVLKQAPRSSGFLLATMPVVLGVIAPWAGSLADKYGSSRIAALGLVVFACSLLGLETLSDSTTPTGYILRYAPVGLGIGLFQSPNNSAILGAAPRDRIGVASGLLAVTRTLGQTTGIALLTAFWTLRVAVGAGGLPEGGATHASVDVQMSALRDTMLLMLGLTGVSLFLVCRALWMSRHPAPATATAAAK
ncbi:MAG TPA: DHA2 family efflux MFS transporter permease subunit [Polyangiaceae bacterium]|nr:DHA2 family efflux MFS transporter permease subunit [Polyangiaceae bacterium]